MKYKIKYIPSSKYVLTLLTISRFVLSENLQNLSFLRREIQITKKIQLYTFGFSFEYNLVLLLKGEKKWSILKSFDGAFC